MYFSQKFASEDLERSTYERAVRAPIFRKSFTIDIEPIEAKINICGLGFYDLFVNGRKITKGYLAPYISNPDHYVYYDVYDILPELVKGENVIAVMLGDGFTNGKTNIWNLKDNSTNSSPRLAVSVDIASSGETLHFEVDDFVCKKGPILFNDLRSGVFYDAGLEEKGWTSPGFAEKGWHAPIMVSQPRGIPRVCEAEPIRVYRHISPVSIVKGELTDTYKHSEQITEFLKTITPFEGQAAKTGGYIYDFGENNSGIFRLRINGVRGQKIDIQCAEQLSDGKVDYSNIGFFPDGFSQRDIYYLSGEGEEIFEPMFVYHGFRYIYISGITEEQATPDLLTFLVMSSSLEQRGGFECSDPVANKIYEMGRRSDVSNFFYFPTDCPHREKNGWTGDASVSAEHMIMTIGAEKSWHEWLNNIRAAQTEDGMLPGIVPTCDWGYEWGNGPAWDSVLFNLPYFAYKYRGDIEIIRENADSMLKYLKYIALKRDNRGIVEIGLGDWVPVGDREADDYDADLGFTDSVMVLDMCTKASEMFESVGLLDHMKFAQSMKEEMLSAIRSEYIDFNTLTVKNRCQTSQAMGIFYDVFDASEKSRAFDVLMEIIRSDNYSITSGFLGLRVIFHVLSEFGESETAYMMITKKEFPSYGYWVEKGETTFLEQFKRYDGYFPLSKNHHFLGDVVNWFMSRIAGLQVIDSKHVMISPGIISSLDWCTASHKLPHGDLRVEWKREDNDDILLLVHANGDVGYTVDGRFKRISDGVYKLT